MSNTPAFTTTLEAFTHAKDIDPNAVALLTPGKADTRFGELFERNDEVRNQLASFGLQRGMRIGIVGPTRDAMAAAHFAVITTCTSAPLSVTTTPDELEFAITDFGLKAVILEQGLDELRAVAERLGVIVITMVPSEDKAGLFELEGPVTDPGAIAAAPEPDDAAVLLHTSGTTSRPKIVARSQSEQVRSVGEFRGDTTLRPGDRVICALPLHHTQGLNSEFMRPLLTGASVLIVDFQPDRFIDQVEKYGVTKFTLVPSMHRMVLEHVKHRRDIFKGTQLRWIESSSAALTVKTRLEMQPVYGVPIIEGYGATEAGRIIQKMGFDQSDLPLGSVGKRAHDGVAIMDEDGNELPPNTVGEICVDHPNNLREYENNPEANARAFRNGYYRTGDLGYFDENDYLFIKGRVTETISRGGEKFAPAEIDEVLLQHQEIAQAAAFAVSHEQLGHEVWAAVIPANGSVLNPGQIRAFASQKLSFARVPKRIVIVDELPYNEVGKVMRRKLTEQYEEEALSKSS